MYKKRKIYKKNQKNQTTVELTRMKIRWPKEKQILSTFGMGQQMVSYPVFLLYCHFKMHEIFYYA